MKQFTRRVRQVRRSFFDTRIIVAVIGIILSIVLHELIHVVFHWGHITHIGLFSSHGAIVEILSTTAISYDPLIEEAIAYAVTLSTLLATAVATAYTHDKRDTKSFTQTVFPKNSSLHRLSKQELFELASRVNLL